MTQVILIENRSALITEAQLVHYLPAWQSQLNDHLRAFWRDLPYFALQLGNYVASNGWGLILEDTTVQQGDLGYHDKETGGPVARVDVQSCQQFNSDVSVVVGHELCEMAVDPDVRTMASGAYGRALVEVCDPFIVTSSVYHISDVAVPNFTTPAYWGLGIPSAGGSRFDMKASVQAPFPSMPHGGYTMIIPPGSNTWVTKFETAGCSAPDVAWIEHCARTSMRCQVATERLRGAQEHQSSKEMP